MPASDTVSDASSSSPRCPPAVCVAAVLGDPLHRVIMLVDRDGMPRSLGSVYGGTVTRFLGGGLRGVVSHSIMVPCATTHRISGVAVNHDGLTLLAADGDDGDDDGGAVTVVAITVAGRDVLRVTGGRDAEQLRFDFPRHLLYTAADGFMFVAERHRFHPPRVTRELDFHGFVGVGDVHFHVGVCADADVVIVSDGHLHRVTVCHRADGSVVTHFGSSGDGDGQLSSPAGVCFVEQRRCVAVADCGNNRVAVFTIDGTFVRHVGVGVLVQPKDVAASAFDELVVADYGNNCIRVFSDVGELLLTLHDGVGALSSVAVHGSTVFGMECHEHRCVLWS